jgi:hypothetical protein
MDNNEINSSRAEELARKDWLNSPIGREFVNKLNHRLVELDQNLNTQIFSTAQNNETLRLALITEQLTLKKVLNYARNANYSVNGQPTNSK